MKCNKHENNTKEEVEKEVVVPRCKSRVIARTDCRVEMVVAKTSRRHGGCAHI
jgi:hypothetical protein